MDETFNQPPWFRPTLPTYPEVCQVTRIYAPALSGTNCYPAYVQQYNGDLTFRDREACYVVEPNGIALKAGRYDCRLVGSYNGLPLFAATCCPSGSFDSSSGSSSSSSTSASSQTPMARTNLTTFNALGNQTISITVQTGVVVVSMSALQVGLLTVPVVKYNGVVMTTDSRSGEIAVSGVVGETFIFSIPVSAASASVTITADNAEVCVGSIANITGLTRNVVDVQNFDTGLATSPNTGMTNTTSYANEFAQAAFFLLASSGGLTWGNDFTSGNSLTGTLGGIAYRFVEAYKQLSALETVQGFLSGLTLKGWGGCVDTYS